MYNLFERIRPDATAISRAKDLIINHFDLPPTTVLTVAELKCQEHGCPPIETVFTARHVDGTISDWRITKPVKDISVQDIIGLKKQ